MPLNNIPESELEARRVRALWFVLCLVFAWLTVAAVAAHSFGLMSRSDAGFLGMVSVLGALFCVAKS